MSSSEDIAKLCWQRGSQAVNNEDYDYATDMFYKSVTLVHDNLAYRQSLRGAEFRKYKNNQKGAGMMARPKLISIRTKLSRAKSKKDWDLVDKLAEEGLLLNPWDANFNSSAAQACHQRGYNSVAIFLYQVAVGPGGDPENVELQKEFAAMLQADERFTEARTIWKKVYELSPGDGEARSNMNACDFEAARKKGKYDDASSTRDVMPTHEINKRLNINQNHKGQADAPGMDPEKDLLHAIRKDPKSIELHQKLAELYEEKKDFDQARETYEKALELSGGDQNIKELLEDLELKVLAVEVEKAKYASKGAAEDEKLKAKAIKLTRKLLDREIEIFADRTERYPQNRRMKFNLAKRYHRLKRWSDAIPLYQQSSIDPRMEIEALTALGKCFLQDNKQSLAEKQFVKVAPKLNFADHPDAFKEVHYMLGRIYEQSKKPQESEDHYSEILAIDYDYKDVRERLEKLAEA